ncbi:MAG: Ig-like domain-containing protein, partial [Clostridia bacterium]|nr:Ig-like domain-containing protein [Clostridia bacterium]
MKRGTKWLSALLTVTMLATGTGSFALAESTDGTTTQQEQVSTPEAGTEQKESAEIDQTAASAQEGEGKPTESGTDEKEPTDVGNTTPEEEAPAIELTELTLSSGAVSLEEGQSCTLSATANAGATLGEVTWTSSNADVASVSGGTVTGKAPGTATVTASCGNVSASCTVTVTAKTVAITGVSITGGADVVYADETTTFGYTYAPENADVSGVEWGVSDGSVATIANGLLTAHKPGSVTVTVTCTAPDGASVSAEKKVTVLRRATGIALSASSATLDVGGSAQLTATVTPADATDAVTWISDNESVAQVDASGKVTAIGVGKANITVKCGEQSASCAVSVEKMPTAIELYTKTLTLYPGQVGTIRQTILPADATMKSLKWTSSNPAVATVSESGDVTGVAAGSCVITASTGNGISVSCSVTIVKQGQAVTSIKLNKSALSLVRTKTAKLKATVSPSKATDKGVIWLSSDPSIATVSSNGTVTGVKAGTVTITAFASNGMYKSCVVSVTPLAVSSVKMNKRSASLTFGATGQLTATVSPANADNTAVKWTSSNPAVVSVDESGHVTALKSGSATITAQTANGKKATCKVTVKGITVKLNKKSASLDMGATGQLTATLAATSAEYSKVTWTSSNPAVATVDANGLVTALKSGTTTITATSVSGNKATCKVTVKGITVKLNKK